MLLKRHPNGYQNKRFSKWQVLRSRRPGTGPQKWEFQKSAGGSTGTGAGKNGGADRSAGAGAGRLFCLCFFSKGPACQHLRQHSGQHPHFCQHLCQHPCQHFSGIPIFGVLYQVAGISRQVFNNQKTCHFENPSALLPLWALLMLGGGVDLEVLQISDKLVL